MNIVERVNLDFTPPVRDGYVLPYIFDQIKISQGYNEPYSHFAMKIDSNLYQNIIDGRFGIDFQVPFETKVIATKAGIVRGTISFNDGVYQGLDPEIGFNIDTNFIILTHQDGSRTLYSHLAKSGAVVRRGQEVEQGQLLGLTGPSGWIGPTPHLHFECYDNINNLGLSRCSFPVRFNDYQGPLEHSQL